VMAGSRPSIGVARIITHAKEFVANARLIAAAPTMAEELREQAAFIRRFLEHLVPKSSWVAGYEVNSWAAAEIPDWELRQRLEGLEAAIAKTEGRS